MIDVTARTISGLVVPFGQVGETSQGRLQYGPGSLRWSDPRRVKLLVEHDQRHAQIEVRVDVVRRQPNRVLVGGARLLPPPEPTE